ncbi:MAG: hypothetical protein KAF27_01290 [Porphyrobacter sp.]|nr:hypothetical protein [Porphyrobacter sp.]
MGSDTKSGPGDEPGSAFVGRLADQARKLQREARTAIAEGDYARASALIGDAELLAEDVHGLVDDIEHRESDRIIGHAAAEAEAEGRRRRSRLLPLRRHRIGLALGAGLAITLALAKC